MGEFGISLDIDIAIDIDNNIALRPESIDKHVDGDYADALVAVHLQELVELQRVVRQILCVLPDHVKQLFFYKNFALADFPTCYFANN